MVHCVAAPGDMAMMSVAEKGLFMTFVMSFVSQNFLNQGTAAACLQVVNAVLTGTDIHTELSGYVAEHLI